MFCCIFFILNLVKNNICFFHIASITEKIKSDKIKQKLLERKERRQIESKLLKAKPLGESDDEDDDAQVWVEKNRRLQQEKEEAEKRVCFYVIFELFYVIFLDVITYNKSLLYLGKDAGRTRC